jgi:hypothetical protein
MDDVSPTTVTAIELAQVGETWASLRLRPPEALREMERSLSRHGQLVAVVCWRHAGSVEIVDGFYARLRIMQRSTLFGSRSPMKQAVLIAVRRSA